MISRGARVGRRRLGAFLVVAVLATGLGLTPALSAGATGVAPAGTRGFTSVYSANTTGNILLRGNTLMTCPAGSTANGYPPTGTYDLTCAQAQGPGLWGRDNDFSMQYVNTDPAAVTAGYVDSSSAKITIPGGATVLQAFLLWSGQVTGTGTGQATFSSTLNTVELKAPGQAYVPETSAVVDSTATSGAIAYQGITDVTSAVQGAGSGMYTVANVKSTVGGNEYAGWSLAIAYQDPTQPDRNLDIYSGFANINTGNDNVAIPLSGFTTPATGPVVTEVGVVGWEGDRGNVGDSMTVGTSQLSNAVNPVNDVFNSTMSDLGTAVTDGNPTYQNTLGTDIDTFDGTGSLADGATSTTVHMTTAASGGETYYPGLVTFATTLASPSLTATKTVGDVTDNTVTAGDTLNYAVAVKNTGTNGATTSVLTDVIPSGVTYVAGSLTVGGVAVTDATGDDTGQVSAGTVTAWIGTGATAGAGGQLAVGASTTVAFSATVKSAANGTVMSNTAHLTYKDATTSVAFSGASDTTTSTIGGPTLAFSAPPAGQVGVAYTDTLAAQGGTSPYTWSIHAGTLPPGITLDAATGVLSGTPTAVGTYDITVWATDASGYAGSEATSITVSGLGLSISTPPVGEATAPYTDTLTATGGTGPYTYAVTSGALPAGLTLSAAGVISGRPTAAAVGTTVFSVTVTDSTSATAAGETSISVVAGPALVTAPPSGEVGAAYSATLAATGGTGPYTYSVTTGSLPAGMALSTAGVLTGPPTTAGTTPFTVTATDAKGGYTADPISLTVAADPLLASTPPDGEVGAAYTATTLSATLGTAPYTYAVTAGALPAGLTLSSAGVLSGTPTAAGTSSFTVGATDAKGRTATEATSITVIGGPVLGLPAPPAESKGTAFSYPLAVSGGTAPYEWMVSSGSMPAGVTLNFATGVLSGTPTVAGTFPFTVEVVDAKGQSASAPVVLVVDPAAVLSVSVGSVRFGTAVTFTASLSPVDASGSVTFTDVASSGPESGQTVTIGSATLAGGVATLSVALPAFGTNTVTATYGGSSTYGPAVSPSAPVQVNGYLGELIVDEMRLSGPGGANDSYVELYNPGPAAVPMAGFALLASSGQTLAVPANGTTVLPAGHAYLFAGGGYSLAAVAAADTTTSASLGANGVQVTAPDAASTVVDAVGSVGATTGFYAGTALPALTGTPTNQYAWVRLEKAGVPVDTNDNGADFKLVSTTGGVVGGVASTLGSPAPRGSVSPDQSNNVLHSTLLDSALTAGQAPNFVYAPGTPGVLTVRRTITNTSGATVTSAVVRITALSEANGVPEPGVATQPAHPAGLRLVDPSTPTSSITVGGSPVTVDNLSPDAPAAASPGGGLNTTLTVPLSGGLAAGATVSIAFTFDVDTGGTYWFGYDIDALTGSVSPGVVRPAFLRLQPLALRSAPRSAPAASGSDRNGGSGPLP